MSSKPSVAPSEDVAVELLLSVLVLEGLLRVEGGELQDAANGPVREGAEEIAEVGPGLDVVKLAGGEERYEGGVDCGGRRRCDEEPVLAAHSLPPQRSLWPLVPHAA